MALAGPVLGHLDPQFLALLDSTNDRLRQVFGTSNALTLPVSGTGSAGMEASFVNFVHPGDPVVVGVNGVFGERMCEVAFRHGAEVVRVDAEWGEPIDPDSLLAAHPAPALIAVVHAETSTGVRNDIAPLGRGKGEALLLVDMVTSLGGIEVAVDDWSVDIAYSGTQKCLGVPPGLSPFTVSERALERIVERPSSWYLDLNLLARYVNDASGGARVYHHTAPVMMVAALHAGLGALLDEGLKRFVGAPCRVRPAPAGRVGPTSASNCSWPPITVCRSSPPSGSRPESTTPRYGASSSRPMALRSAPVPAGWPGRSGASAAWGTPHAGATWSRCWAR